MVRDEGCEVGCSREPELRAGRLNGRSPCYGRLRLRGSDYLEEGAVK